MGYWQLNEAVKGLYSFPSQANGTLLLQLIRQEAVTLIFSGIFIFLCIIAIFFFSKRRQEREYLYFGIGTGCMGVYTFYTSPWSQLLGTDLFFAGPLYYMACFSVVPTFARFTYECLATCARQPAVKADRLFQYFTRLACGYALLLDFFVWVYADADFWYVVDGVVNSYVSLLVGAAAVGYLLYKLLKREPDSKLMVIASTIAFCGGIFEVLSPRLHLPPHLAMWGMMSFILLITIVLGKRFFRLQSQVEAYSADLEQMVVVRTQQLENLEESRRRMLANISHDLRMPVASVLGHTELMLEGLVDSPAQQQIYIQRIHTKMLGLSRLIQDLFELTTLETQMERFQMKPLSARGVLDDIYRKYQFDVQNAGVNFYCDTALPYEVQVKGDADRLDQLFSNLIANAIRYTQPGGSIRLCCEQADTEMVLTADDLPAVCYSVADDGIGIAPEHIPHIFERFYRAVDARQSFAEHSGLGLAIAQEIVTAHGGRIWVDPQQEGGCIIHFSLPVA